ncbi:MAG: GTP cyclohydrolase II [Polyangiaceae bacterium]|nr:GTP cyclohydrolase II [Polyangiaceae bacterium]
MHVPVRVIRPHTEWIASADLPTRFGHFKTHVFRTTQEASLTDGARVQVMHEHVALVHGNITGGAAVPVRIHSECMTSEVFGSLKCDCKEQLDAAFAEVVRRGAGAVLYLRQEGRGIGLANKIRAYDLQSHGADTVDANRLLGLPDDAREYHAAADMLEHFAIKSVLLMTNNPAKVEGLSALGIEVVGRMPVVIPPNPFSRGYLETKRARMGHELPARLLDEAEALLGPFGTAANGEAE